jgi:hypothetical protein
VKSRLPLFDIFIDCITPVSKVCSDLNIQGGILRQRDNDKKHIFEADLTPLIGDIDLSVLSLKQKLKHFKVIKEPEFSTGEEYYTFYYGGSEYKVKIPQQEDVLNEFIPEEKLEAIKNKLLLRILVPSRICRGIKVFSKRFRKKSYKALFKENDVLLHSKIKGERVLTTLRNVLRRKAKGFMQISTIPFTLVDKKNILWEIYSTKEKNIFTNCFKVNYSGIDLAIYTKSKLRGRLEVG